MVLIVVAIVVVAAGSSSIVYRRIWSVETSPVCFGAR